MTYGKQFIGLAIAALAGVGLHAQSVDLRAAIPFDFYAGNKLIPAGDYRVESAGAVVLLRDASTGNSVAALMTVGTISRDKPGEARLNFGHYGAEYFLTSVWNPFTPEGRQVLLTARQRELLAARGDVPHYAIVTVESSK